MTTKLCSHKVLGKQATVLPPKSKYPPLTWKGPPDTFTSHHHVPTLNHTRVRPCNDPMRGPWAHGTIRSSVNSQKYIEMWFPAPRNEKSGQDQMTAVSPGCMSVYFKTIRERERPEKGRAGALCSGNRQEVLEKECERNSLYLPLSSDTQTFQGVDCGLSLWARIWVLSFLDCPTVQATRCPTD